MLETRELEQLMDRIVLSGLSITALALALLTVFGAG